ncbi:MAG: MATE family efflux transporter [Clostridium sp.]|nr:MATE family efflux transporter [Clostridium sp.]
MSNPAQAAENKMGTMPINKLLISMSLPMILSMLVQALYNIVDSIFVAQISENALTAVSLAFPVQSLLIAVSAGTCVGVNALLSRSLGERRQEEANLAACNGIFLAVASFLVFALLGIFGSHAYFAGQTDNAEIISFGTDYLTICLGCSFGLFLEMMTERLMQSTGRTFLSMITQGTGAIVNIILDPILIFGLFGFPRLGISGAAIATVTGQIIAMILAIWLNQTKNPDITVSLKAIRPNRRVIARIYEVGVPSIIMQSIVSVMTFGMNKILILFSETAVSVLGVYFKLQSFIFMPIFGLNNGLIPIVAYNYGAASRKRIMETIRLGIIIAVSIMLFGLAIFQLFPERLLLLFNASEHMLEIGVPALRIISLSFLFAGYCIIVGSVFQALGNGVYSLIVSVARQLLCILPLAYLFAKLWGLHAVWYSFALAELISVTLSTILFRRIYLEKIKPLDDIAGQKTV